MSEILWRQESILTTFLDEAGRRLLIATNCSYLPLGVGQRPKQGNELDCSIFGRDQYWAAANIGEITSKSGQGCKKDECITN